MGAMAPTASWSTPQSAVHGVSTSPGAMALTRSPGPRAFASSAVRWLSAAFDAAYGTELPTGRTPASEVQLKSLSHDRARRAGGLPLPPPLSRHRQLSEVADTLGVLADLLGTAPRPDLPVVDRAGQTVADDIKSVLARLATLSLRTRAPDGDSIASVLSTTPLRSSAGSTSQRLPSPPSHP